MKYFLPFDNIADLERKSKMIIDAQRDYIREVKGVIRINKIDHLNLGELEVKVEAKDAQFIEKISNEGVLKAFMDAGIKKQTA